MIRVNLLPTQRERRRAAPEGSHLWLLVVTAFVVLEIVTLFFFHQTKEEELAQIQGQVNQLDSQIGAIKALVKDHEEVKKALEELRAREDAIAKLQAGRRGPTAVLLELSRVLSRGKTPTMDPSVATEQVSFNPAWDPRRVWLLKYQEEERNVKIEGRARDGSDVYEIAQRLKLSRFFSDVELLAGKQESDASTKSQVVAFALKVKVHY
ncbi:MAG: PilN domain-containing protein [Deltaproteobacteria bacterium]|nr:PilN domain-containing protein [Deltaproteobacteria bacterium]